MSETTPVSPAARLETSPRQKRLRSITVVILVFIASMMAVAIWSPFFHPVTPSVMTSVQRKALAAQYMMILGYYTVIFALAISLLFIAWLYVREIRLQLLMAQRDIWQNIVDRHADERAKKSGKWNGSE